MIGWPDNCRLSDCLPDIIWLWQDFLDWAGLPSSAPAYVLFDWVGWVWLALRSFAQVWWKWLLGWLIIISAGWFFRWRSFTRLWPYNCFPQFQYFSSLGCQAQFHCVCTFHICCWWGPEWFSNLLSVLRYWSCFCEESSSCQAAGAVCQVLPMYCQSTFRSVWGSHFFFVFYCHESPNVLPSTFTLPGESRQCLLPDVSWCTVRVPLICLGELHLHFVPVGPDFVCQILPVVLLVFGLSSVDPAPEQESSSRRAALSAAKCFQYTVRVPSIRLGKSLSVFYCQVSPNVLPSTFNLSGESLQSLLPSISWNLVFSFFQGVTSACQTYQLFFLSSFTLQFYSRLYKFWGLINKRLIGLGRDKCSTNQQAQIPSWLTSLKQVYSSI